MVNIQGSNSNRNLINVILKMSLSSAIIMLSQDADDTEEYENEYDDIDPLEKEWMLAGAQADLDGLYRLLMAEPLLINRKGFLHGYSAMHWAAKHGRMDILTMLLFQGGSPNIKSVSDWWSE